MGACPVAYIVPYIGPKSTDKSTCLLLSLGTPPRAGLPICLWSAAALACDFFIGPPAKRLESNGPTRGSSRCAFVHPVHSVQLVHPVHSVHAAGITLKVNHPFRSDALMQLE